MLVDTFESIVAWAVPAAFTLTGGLLALLRYFNDKQEKGALLLRREIATLRDDVEAGDEAARIRVEACRSQQSQIEGELRLIIARQREKMAEHRLDIAERMLNKDDFREFSHRLEERLGRIEAKLDHISAPALAH